MGCGVAAKNHLMVSTPGDFSHPLCGKDVGGHMWEMQTFKGMAHKNVACDDCLSAVGPLDLSGYSIAIDQSTNPPQTNQYRLRNKDVVELIELLTLNCRQAPESEGVIASLNEGKIDISIDAMIQNKIGFSVHETPDLAVFMSKVINKTLRTD
jgi:hypothetical protein